MNIQRPVVWAIASATIIGASLTTYAMGQEQARIGTGQGGGIHTAANAVPASKTNEVIQLLLFGISESQNTLIAKTSDSNMHARVIEACNRAVFAAKTPSEQEDYRKVIDIDKWAPNKSVWREIAGTKSMVKELLNVTPQQNKLAEKLSDAIWDKIVKPTPEVIKQTPMLGLKQEEKLREQANAPNSKIVQMHRRWLEGQIGEAMKEVRDSLTIEQKAEWDAIWALYQKHLPKITP